MLVRVIRNPENQQADFTAAWGPFLPKRYKH